MDGIITCPPCLESRFDEDVWGHVVGSRRRLREGHVVMVGAVEGGNIWEAAIKFRALAAIKCAFSCPFLVGCCGTSFWTNGDLYFP